MRKFIFSLVGVIFLSCNNENKKELIEKIDSLKNIVNEINKKFSKIDLIEINSLHYYSDSLMRTVSDKLSTYPPNELRTAFLSFTYCIKPLYEVKTSYKNIEKEIIFTKEQLTNLKHEIIENKIKQEKAKEYIKNEIDAINSLDNRVTEILSKVNYGKYIFYNMLDSANMFVNEVLKTKK